MREFLVEIQSAYFLVKSPRPGYFIHYYFNKGKALKYISFETVGVIIVKSN